MEAERKDRDSAWLLTHPRELCNHCWEWINTDDCELYGLSGCAARLREVYNNYLLGQTDECRYFFEK